MDQRKRSKTRPKIDEAFLEQLRNDPNVIYRERTSSEPFEPWFHLTGPLDVNWLIGRRDDHEVAPHLRGIDDAPVAGQEERQMTVQTEMIPRSDEARRERLRRDPRVVRHVRTRTEPFVPEIWLTAPVDELWLAGRREDDEVKPSLRGIDE